MKAGFILMLASVAHFTIEVANGAEMSNSGLSMKSSDESKTPASGIQKSCDSENDAVAGLGKIVIEARFPDKSLNASIGIDCCGTSRKYMDLINAEKRGFEPKGTLSDGESLTLNVPAGEHELFAFDNVNLSGLDIVDVEAGKTQKIVCKAALEYNNLKPTYPKYRYDFSNVTNGLGLVRVHAAFSSTGGTVQILIGGRWYKDCHPCKAGEKGAFLCGYDARGEIKSGETQTFEVPAGQHIVRASGGDFLNAENLTIEVTANKTQKIICGDNLNFAEKILYPAVFLVKGGRAKRYFSLTSAM